LQVCFFSRLLLLAASQNGDLKVWRCQLDTAMLGANNVLVLLAALVEMNVWVDGAPFNVALWGDMPYFGNSDNVFDNTDSALLGGVSMGVLYGDLRDSINDSNPYFSFHVGDYKFQTSPCYGNKYMKRFEDLVNSVKAPVFLSLGDNDWTDCSGHIDLQNFRIVTQSSALQSVRERFYSHNGGGKPILGSNADSWSTEVKTGGSNYPELQRFMYQDIMFVVVHVVGSNNNRDINSFSWAGIWNFFSILLSFFTNDAQSEYQQRNAKVNGFLQTAFQEAQDVKAKGVMVVGHAHFINFNESSPSAVLYGNGFDDFWATLRTEAFSFGKPVAYIHGDSHFFKNYIPDTALPNLQALMVPGKDSIGWVHAEIDGDDPSVFSFTHVDLTPIGYTPEVHVEAYYYNI
jgi:hypothetical protein